MRYYPDYDLIDRLTRLSNQSQDRYVAECPHLPEMREIAAQYRAEGWWDTTREAVKAQLKSEGANGMVICDHTGWRYYDDCVWGEIENDDRL